MKTLIFVFLSIMLFVSSCKKESSAPLFNDVPVVNAYLKVGDTARVALSKLTAFDNSAQYSADDINNLNVYVFANDTSYLLNDIGNGNYIASSPLLIIKQDKTYQLKLYYNNKDVTAATSIPSKPTGYSQSVTSFSRTQITASFTPGQASGGFTQPDPVKLTWNNTDNSFYMVVVENMETNPEAVNLRNSTNGGGRIFRNAPIQTNTYEIRPQQFQYFGKHRLILYHLNPDYAALYGSSNNNSNNLTNSQTSVKNGAGIFTGINSDTLYFQLYKQ